MSTQNSKENLEKFKNSISHFIQSIEAKNKRLRKRQLFLESLAERLRNQEMKVVEQLNQLMEKEKPYIQVVNLDVDKTLDCHIFLFLN
jgi:uncharacterized protein YaaR (DUF327 family)